MIQLLVTLVVLVVLGEIVSLMSWKVPQKGPKPTDRVHIVEKAYKSVDIQTEYSYCAWDDGSDHKRREGAVQYGCYELLNQMKGFIEISDVMDINDPFLRKVRLKIKVYKP